MGRVFGYVRVSTARQADEGESLATQERQVAGYAMMKGWALEPMVVERGVSGSVPLAERKEGGPLFAQLKKGDVVISPKLDRLFRSALDALHTIEVLRKRGVSLHLLDIGGDVCGNGVSKLFLTVLSAVAEFERERNGERVSQVKEDQRAAGRYLGGVVPFGWRTPPGWEKGKGGDLVPHAEEQAAIAEIVAMRAEKKSLRSIAAAMKAKGHEISHEGVAGVLRAQPA
jgi:DNA invertase Pin-like site-specific DNA recombinase